MQTLEPSPGEWTRFFTSVERDIGLDLRQYQPGGLQRRILAFAQLRSAGSLEDLWDIVGSSSQSLRSFTDELSVNVSEFYRDQEKWEGLKDRILPDLIERRDSLRCWSAGCSFGAEARTLSILLDVHFPSEHFILGTDIDLDALDRAATGAYSDSELRNVPPEVRKTYFEPGSRNFEWVAKSPARQALVFERGDLLQHSPDPEFDLILCRNVLIYLTDSAKAYLWRKLHDSLRRGGTLFVGEAEPLANCEDFGFKCRLPGFYTRL